MATEQTFAQHQQFFMVEMKYDHPTATFFATLMVLARQAHPKFPMDADAVERVKPDWRILRPIEFITVKSPIRPDFEWGYPF